MLVQEMSSIAKFLYDNNTVELYWSKMPQDFMIPSMYFPIPQTFGANEALKHFKNTYNWFVKVFNTSTDEAMKNAHELLMKIYEVGCRIPLMNEDGTLTGKRMSVRDISISELDDGVAQLSISWDSIYTVTTEVEKMDTIFIGFASKPE